MNMVSVCSQNSIRGCAIEKALAEEYGGKLSGHVGYDIELRKFMFL
jgi:hypothetical protein